MTRLQTGWQLLATWTLCTSFLMVTKTHSKLFDKCSLARTLLYQHYLDIQQVQTWVCIAIHQSNLNTAAVNYDANGIGYHGMYQISDRYWCGTGNICNMNCERLRDDDLHDDLECISYIFAEHSRLSGNGYKAWTAYERHCAADRAPSIDECFAGSVQKVVETTTTTTVATKSPRVEVIDKVYDRCELARELRFVHGLPSEQIATWVCIAKHESNFRTSVVGRLNADGSGDHGLFQISDLYWCSPPGNGWACGVTCADLTDSDISDDVKCIQTIHAEHERISGDGFNAWSVYQPYCKYSSSQFIDGCFAAGELEKTPKVSKVIETKPRPNGKIYSRCELALELRDRHFIAEEQIATWVCIAHHESRYNTSAEGRLNWDGSGDHGLFQISDIYWCSPPGMGWVCGITCDDLMDDDITDDVDCMRKIYAEHQRISGDGFNAWSVYQPYCRGRSEDYIRGCFDKPIEIPNYNSIEFKAPKKPLTYKPSTVHSPSPKPSSGKVYGRCELARELRYVHGIPKDQISTWVCIAKHESHFNTSAVGRLNVDGSSDHGIFQISDIYWCSPPGNGWACEVTCAQLKDSDITDDVKCIRKIYDEHTKISGDGFNAWTVYAPYCRERSSQYTEGCFDEPKVPWEEENEIDYSPTQVIPLKASKAKGKVFERCELAAELRFKHRIPIEQIATWVCIAKHESAFNTSAVGNGDHGLFQISDIYWCSPPGSGWVCGLSCAQLEDSDISDDIECMKKIFEEHERLSGDGFNAWAVYQPSCRGQSEQYTADCFVDPLQGHRDQSASVMKESTGKVYNRCELALEMQDKHNIPKEQISTWVCIVEHESHYNTSAVGRLNADGSADHGLFQISDLFWCSPSGNGGACGVSCDDLENDDITDDARCIKMIWDEHRRLSGDGFNAWTVYPLHCNKGRSDQYLNGCFMDNEMTSPRPSSTTSRTTTSRQTTTTSRPSTHYGSEPTRSTIKTTKSSTTTKFTTLRPTVTRTTTRKMTTRKPDKFQFDLSTTNHPLTSLSAKSSWKSTTQRPATSVGSKSPHTLSSGTTSHVSTKTTSTRKSTTRPPVSTTTNSPYKPKTTSSTTTTTQKPLSTISSKFDLWFNAFTTKKPVTIYQFATTTPGAVSKYTQPQQQNNSTTVSTVQASETTMKPTTNWNHWTSDSTTVKPINKWAWSSWSQKASTSDQKLSTSTSTTTTRSRGNLNSPSTTFSSTIVPNKSNFYEPNSNRKSTQGTEVNKINKYSLSHSTTSISSSTISPTNHLWTTRQYRSKTSTTTTRTTQRPWSTSSSSSSSSSSSPSLVTAIAVDLHSDHSQDQQQQQQQSTPFHTTSTTKTPTSKSFAVVKPFTIERKTTKTTSSPPLFSHSTEITSHSALQTSTDSYPTTTTSKPTSNTDIIITDTDRPSSSSSSDDAPAQAILDKQSITKLAFDKLFDLFKH